MSEPTPRPPIADAPISVILFAHALATDTSDALRAWRQYLDTLARPYEILLIQETRAEVTSGPADEPTDTGRPTRVLAYERALGFAVALNEAIRAAQHPLLAFCPADKQYRPADLERMLKFNIACPKCAGVLHLGVRPGREESITCPTCSEGFKAKWDEEDKSTGILIDQVDLVAGYRKGGQPPAWRVLLDRGLGFLSRVLLGVPLEPRTCWLGKEGWGRRWVARWIFGVRVVDPECPFRLARRGIFEHLPIQSGGPFVQVEILAKANHLSCYLAEEPVAWTPPTMATQDAIPFGQDAWLVFQQPDFGAYDPLRVALANATRNLLAFHACS